MITGSASAPPQRQLRVDAQRSRERILIAARQIVSSEGESASLDRIARAAGVGSATLYRHFPDRTLLFETLFHDHVRGLCDYAIALEATMPPLQALKEWVRRLVRDSIEHRGLSAAMLLAHPEHRGHAGSCHDQVSDAGRRLVSRASASGDLPDGADSEDLAILVTGILGRP